jgi:hypothetical protein
MSETEKLEWVGFGVLMASLDSRMLGLKSSDPVMFKLF